MTTDRKIQLRTNAVETPYDNMLVDLRSRVFRDRNLGAVVSTRMEEYLREIVLLEQAVAAYKEGVLNDLCVEDVLGEREGG